MKLSPPWAISYETLLLSGGDYQNAAMSLSGELVSVWIQADEAAVPSAPVHLIDRSTFKYVFDFAQEHGWPSRPVCNRDSRTAAVIGFSAKGSEARDDHRLKGWVGPTTKRFGATFDKGHFIAHSIEVVSIGHASKPPTGRADQAAGAGSRSVSTEYPAAFQPSRPSS